MLALPLGVMWCSANDPEPETEQPVTPGNNSNNHNDDNDPMKNRFKITINGFSFDAKLDDNTTTAAFRTLLPMTINRSEMNGNEKFYYLTGGLPVSAFNPGTIRAGDLMLYGSSCVMLFHDSFSTSYSYTRLGRMDKSNSRNYQSLTLFLSILPIFCKFFVSLHSFNRKEF